MTSLVHISDAASIGMHSMVLIASQQHKMSAGAIAGRLGVSEFHLSKVLQRLVKGGLVKSSRGPRGGFVLSKNQGAITLLDVYEAIEGPLDGTSCLLDERSCNKNSCMLGDTINNMSALFKNHLGKTKIRDLAHMFREGDAI